MFSGPVDGPGIPGRIPESPRASLLAFHPHDFGGNTVNVKFARRAAVVAGAATLGVTLISGTAHADPTSFRELVGVGSDTTQFVMDGIGGVVVDPNNSPAHLLIASYDAVNPTTGAVHDQITTRSGHASITRPDGSSEGISALINDISTGAGNLDFARSSRGPKDTSTADLTWVPFGVDAVAPAVRSTSTNLAGHNFTLTELKAIYNCTETTIGTTTLHPLLPQPGSGTRAFWESTLGLNDAALPACVSATQTVGGAPVQENEGTSLTDPGDIMPFSIASYIAQTNGVEPDKRGLAILRPSDGQNPTNSNGTLNTGYPYKRDVYNVIKTSRLTETDIKLAFVGSTSKVCTAVDAANGKNLINEFGFGTEPNNACGSTSLRGKN
jgi:hypothetical protein